MFRANGGQLQRGLFDTFQKLPEKPRKRLERSSADTFYRQVIHGSYGDNDHPFQEVEQP